MLMGSFDEAEVEVETWRVSLYDIWPHLDPLRTENITSEQHLQPVKI